MSFVKYPKQILGPIFEYLAKQQKELRSRIRGIKEDDPFRDEARLNDNASDDAEAAEQFGHQRSEVLSEEAEVALKKVGAAMARIKKGNYGACVKCRKMIDTDRLGIDPTVELCIDCAKKAK